MTLMYTNVSNCVAHHWIVNDQPSTCKITMHNHKRAFQALCLKCGGERCFRVYRWDSTPKTLHIVDVAISAAHVATYLAREHAERVTDKIR